MKQDFEQSRNEILEEIRIALGIIDSDSLQGLIDAIETSEQVFFIGVGRVFLALRMFAKRLNHLGVSAHCVGDINETALKPGDLLIVGSGSGESIIPVAITKKAKQLGAKIVHIGSNPRGTISEFTDLMVRIPVKTKLNLEDEIESNQLMSSLFEQCLFLLGDVVCLVIAKKRNIDIDALWKYHANLE